MSASHAAEIKYIIERFNRQDRDRISREKYHGGVAPEESTPCTGVHLDSRFSILEALHDLSFWHSDVPTFWLDQPVASSRIQSAGVGTWVPMMVNKFIRALSLASSLLSAHECEL